MNVASLERCKELYELSGWGDTSFQYTADLQGEFDKDSAAECRNCEAEYGCGGRPSIPAYDLGYLLRKLPPNSWVGRSREGWSSPYAAHIGPEDDNSMDADTPEDAAYKLAIDLIKKGAIEIAP